MSMSIKRYTSFKDRVGISVISDIHANWSGCFDQSFASVKLPYTPIHRSELGRYHALLQETCQGFRICQCR